MHDRQDSRYDNTPQRLTQHLADARKFETKQEAVHCRSFLKQWKVLKDYPEVRRIGTSPWVLIYWVGEDSLYVADPEK